MTELTAITAAFSSSLNRVALLLENPRPLDEVWKEDVAAEFVIWFQSHAAVAALTSPPALTDVHALTLEALRLYNQAAVDIAAGLDTLDSDRLHEGIDKMILAQELIDQAAEAMDEFNQERGMSGCETAASATNLPTRAQRALSPCGRAES